MSILFALMLSAAPPTPVLTAPATAPFVGLVADDVGGVFVARADGVVVHVDADGVVVDELCVDCPNKRVRRVAPPRRGTQLRLDHAFGLARRGENPPLTQNAWDLFVFPYGTTGEPYLEFAPDSPAFWGVVRGAKNTTFTLVDEPGPAAGLVAVKKTKEEKDEVVKTAGPVVETERWRFTPERLLRTLDEGARVPAPSEEAGCAGAPTWEQTLRDVMASDLVSARLVTAHRPSLLWRLLPVVDVAAGAVHVDAAAALVAVFRDGVEHSAPAGFVRRTLQGHVDNDDAAALLRNRTTDMPYGAVSLRFELDRLLGEPAELRGFERAWRPVAEARLARAAALLDEHGRLCARAQNSASSQLRRAAIADELAIVSLSWRGPTRPTSTTTENP